MPTTFWHSGNIIKIEWNLVYFIISKIIYKHGNLIIFSNIIEVFFINLKSIWVYLDKPLIANTFWIILWYTYLINTFCNKCCKESIVGLPYYALTSERDEICFKIEILNFDTIILWIRSFKKKITVLKLAKIKYSMQNHFIHSQT